MLEGKMPLSAVAAVTSAVSSPGIVYQEKVVYR